MDRKRIEVPEFENALFFREPAYASFELLREVAKSSGNIDTVTQEVLARNLDEDAKHYRQQASYSKKQVSRYFARRDWHTLLKIILVIGYNLGSVYLTNGRPDPSVMISSNSAIAAIACSYKLRNLGWFNKRNDQKPAPSNKQSPTSP